MRSHPMHSFAPDALLARESIGMVWTSGGWIEVFAVATATGRFVVMDAFVSSGYRASIPLSRARARRFAAAIDARRVRPLFIDGPDWTISVRASRSGSGNGAFIRCKVPAYPRPFFLSVGAHRARELVALLERAADRAAEHDLLRSHRQSVSTARK